MRLRGKVAIITGGGSGIGQAAAWLFASEGARVVVADIDPVGGKKTVAAILRKKGKAIFVEADIAKEESAKRITEETLKAFGRADILVNSAATFVLKGFDATMSDWQRSLSVNVIGTSMVTKYAAEAMKKNGGGAVINLSSVSAFVAQPNFFAYSATKGAILQMTRNMAMDLAPAKIRVNCVCPGAILTPASYRQIAKNGMTFEQFHAEEGARTFLKRLGKPREVAAAILFLASDDAAYITGTHLMVDGGYTAV
ncbi:MAG TPA: SDR family oxidoreductase [Candidatus Acidoferrum sp.]|jgi:NAD(P)-dependent dehydrogenase (short-subunit alcohol dehydrogenase family)|nr:SDR family oxidoreductase [Candidatus Acidoferrum sp.]